MRNYFYLIALIYLYYYEAQLKQAYYEMLLSVFFLVNLSSYMEKELKLFFVFCHILLLSSIDRYKVL